MTRANNIYGTRQYPEKLIPKLICDAASGQRFQIQGQGTAQRSFLHVSDYCRAVSTILDRGEDGQIYNIPALREYTVLEVVDLVADAMGIDRASFTEFGPDRPHNDCRYGVVGSKLRALGWEPEHLLERDLPHLVEWYRANLHLYHDRPVSRPAAESELMVRYGLQAATLKPAPRSNRWDSQLGEVSRAG